MQNIFTETEGVVEIVWMAIMKMVFVVIIVILTEMTTAQAWIFCP